MSNSKKISYVMGRVGRAGIFAATVLILANALPASALSFNVYLGRDIEGQEEELSRYDLLVLSPRVLSESRSLHQIRELNPDIKLFMIFDLLSGNDGDVNALSTDFSDRIHDDWKMRSTTGDILSTWPETFLCNLTEFSPRINGQQYRDYAYRYLEKNVLPRMGEFDGLFLDECIESILWIDGSFDGDFDLNGDKVADHPDSVHTWVRRGWEGLLDDIRERHPNLPIIGNGNNHYFSQLNGRMFEDFPNSSFGNLMGGLAQMETWRMNQDEALCLINATAELNEDTERRAGWALGNFSNMYLGFDGGPWEHNHLQWTELFEYDLGEVKSNFSAEGEKLLDRHYDHSKLVEGLYAPVQGRWVGGESAVWGDGSVELSWNGEGWHPLISANLDAAAAGREVVFSMRYHVVEAPNEGVKLYQAFRAHSGSDSDKVSLPTRTVFEGESGYILSEGHKALSNRNDYYLYLAVSEGCKIVVDELRVLKKSSAYLRQDYRKGVLVHSLAQNSMELALAGEWHPDPSLTFQDTWYEMERGEVMLRAGETLVLLPGSLPVDENTDEGSGEVEINGGSSLPQEDKNSFFGAAFPNPFNPHVTIPFSLEHAGRVRAEVFDLRGRRVASLVDEVYSAGAHALEWRGRDDRGSELSSGVYLLRIQGGGEQSLQKLILAS
ncbi:T9SS type A sorting domain-containing protein [bacterium]|nr:T9SS type A sorting domain-containing protein [bacterium]